MSENLMVKGGSNDLSKELLWGAGSYSRDMRGKSHTMCEDFIEEWTVDSIK